MEQFTKLQGQVPGVHRGVHEAEPTRAGRGRLSALLRSDTALCSQHDRHTRTAWSGQADAWSVTFNRGLAAGRSDSSAGLTRAMRDTFENHRTELLDGLRRFVVAARSVAGVRQIALVGSIVTTKPNPKDIDGLVVLADDADLALLAKHARRLQGHAQSFNRGADVFVADGRGNYIGRTCRWKDCRPGVRQACDARHCGRRPYLHDDLDAMTLSRSVVSAPPVTLWPIA